MKNKYDSYINEFFYLTVISIIGGIITLVTGYGYSPATGLVKGNRLFSVFFFIMALIAILLNIVYVHLKRKNKEKGKYDGD